MSVRRDPRTDRWYFRARVTFPDGKRDRISGTPGVPGPYHDLPNTQRGAAVAEQRAITTALTGRDLKPANHKEVPTIREYATPFMDLYAAAHKPSSKLDKRQRLDAYVLPAVGHLRLDELRQRHVDEIVANLLANGHSRKGVNNTTAVLSSLIGYAVTNRVIADPGLTFGIKTQSTELAALESSDVDRLISKADDRYGVAIMLAADAGLRIGEIRALPWLEINEVQRELSIARSYDRSGALTETKSWERRTVPITPRLWSALSSLQRRGALVFGRLDGRPIGYDAVRDRVHEIYVAAQVEPTSQPWHALRHTFGTQLAQRGAPPATIQKLMGHKSIETTMRYVHVDRAAKRAAIAMLSGVGSGRAADSKATSK